MRRGVDVQVGLVDSGGGDWEEGSADLELTRRAFAYSAHLLGTVRLRVLRRAAFVFTC